MQTKSPNIFSKEIKFLGAATTLKNLQIFDTPEVAFFGKSNAGKSSLINGICQRKSLARVSKTPGCTRQINFFDIAGQFILADLPGYGYSKVSKEVANNWENLIIHYLESRQNLVNIMLLIDARRGLQDHDMQIIEIILFYKRAFDVVFTKCDQITMQSGQDLESRSMSLLRQYQFIPNLYFTSSRNKAGLEELRHYLSSVNLKT